MKILKARVWDIDSAKMSAGIDLDVFMQNEEELQFPKTDESLPFKDFLFFRKEYSGWMLFTGLKDKNGKEIYEGDILKRSNEKNPSFLAVIEFSNGSFGGATIPYRKHWLSMSRLSTCDHGGTGYDEIIGNIYENPELISTPSPDKINKE